MDDLEHFRKRLKVIKDKRPQDIELTEFINKTLQGNAMDEEPTPVFQSPSIGNTPGQMTPNR